MEPQELRYRYDGQHLSYEELVDRQDAGEARAVHFVPTTPRTGIAYAFDSEAEMDAWGKAQGLPTVPTEAQTRRREDRRSRDHVPGRQGTAAKPSGEVEPLDRIPGCDRLIYGSRLFDGTNCSGDWLGIFRDDAVPELDQYGFGSRTDSVNIQDWTDCIVSLTLYDAKNYGSGAFTNRYTADSNGTAFNLPTTQRNRVDSVKSTCS